LIEHDISSETMEKLASFLRSYQENQT